MSDILFGLDNVSRETMERLKAFVGLIEKWNPKINLIGRSTLGDIWNRHIADSVQLYDHARPAETWADLGSGGGLPGAVVAMLATERNPAQTTILVESDQRKAAFLRAVARETDTPMQVMPARIEAVDALNADVISARALADLPALLHLAQSHLAPGGICLFPKGKSWQTEVEQARQEWTFELDHYPSRTDAQAAILKIRGLSRGKIQN